MSSKFRIAEEVEVKAYSGYRANERPLSFRLGERTLAVTALLETRRDPAHDCFRVLAEDGGKYLLRWHRKTDRWSLLRESEGGGGRPDHSAV